MAKQASIHSGHRQRLKQAMLDSNFNGISDINLLEAVLFYSIHRADTNEIAHRLLEQFGSVEAVFEADFEDLKHVEGIGENSAFLIKLIAKTAKRIQNVNSKKAVFIRSNAAAAEVFKPYFVGEKDEVMVAMYLDNANKLIRTDVLARGVVNAVRFDNRKLVEGAVRTNCALVILAHNHPHGLPNPSREDLEMTRQIRTLLESINVKLLDHLITADGEWRSVSEMPKSFLYLSKTQ